MNSFLSTCQQPFEQVAFEHLPALLTHVFLPGNLKWKCDVITVVKKSKWLIDVTSAAAEPAILPIEQRDVKLEQPAAVRRIIKGERMS